MKKIIIGIIIGVAISTVSVIAYSILATDVSYNPENENFDVDNVDSALNTLYDLSDDLYNRIDSSFNYASYHGGSVKAETTTLSLDKGHYFVIISRSVSGVNTQDKPKDKKTIYTSDTFTGLPKFNFNNITCELLGGDSHEFTAPEVWLTYRLVNSSNFVIFKCETNLGGSITYDNSAANDVPANPENVRIASIKID